MCSNGMVGSLAHHQRTIHTECSPKVSADQSRYALRRIFFIAPLLTEYIPNDYL
jgi:hypothetical protein